MKTSGCWRPVERKEVMKRDGQKVRESALKVSIMDVVEEDELDAYLGRRFLFVGRIWSILPKIEHNFGKNVKLNKRVKACPIRFRLWLFWIHQNGSERNDILLLDFGNVVQDLEGRSFCRVGYVVIIEYERHFANQCVKGCGS